MSANVHDSQQTQNICLTFVQRRPNVFDVGPTLYKCYTNVLCLLGLSVHVPSHDRGRILVQVTIYRRLRIGRDGHLDQSEAYDLS